jgi:two-component system, chemotaxis family, CheB/CheR fusion protein
LGAFTALLSHLPQDTGMGFVLLQHLDPTAPSALTAILAKATPLPLREAADGLPVEPNHISVIPPGANLSIANGVLRLSARPKTGVQHSIDFFLESLAQDKKE